MSGFLLFAYGTLRTRERAAGLLGACRPAGAARVHGTLYDIDGDYPALMLYGDTPVDGEVWECPAMLLRALDEYEGVTEGLFRRMGVEAEAADGSLLPCWTYVAGPALAPRLTADRRVAGWPPAR